MQHKKKVIFFINSYSGGAEKMTLNIAAFLAPEYYDVIFYIIDKNNGHISNFIPNNKIVHTLKIKSYKDFLIIKMVKIFLKEKPDFVFCSLIPINWRICFASVFFPSISVILRSNDYLYTQSIIQKIRLFIAYRFAKYLIVQTDEMKYEHLKVLKLSPKKVITLSNPVNQKSIDKKISFSDNPFNNNYINYVFVGRISYVKGVDILIKAFAEVLKKQPSSLLYIVGEITGIFEDDYKNLIKIAKNLNIQDKIIFTGFTDNPYIYMKYANCFVLSSRNEGLPNVVIESLYMGTPVVATLSIPVIKRIIKHKINGYIVEVDNIKELAEAMKLAPKLGRITSYYQSAKEEDFIKLFK